MKQIATLLVGVLFAAVPTLAFAEDGGHSSLHQTVCSCPGTEFDTQDVSDYSGQMNVPLISFPITADVFLFNYEPLYYQSLSETEREALEGG